ncbi:MAG: MSCRAMM family protein [Anaerovoracaceae bacterium]|jgi:hypothetical protein
MKSMGKRLLAFLCIAVMCVTFTPITASASGGSIEIAKDVTGSLFGARKTLDLQSAGASVQFTNEDRKANEEEAAREYDAILSDTLDTFNPFYYGMAEYVQDKYKELYNLTVDLTDGSGKIAENWPILLAEQASSNEEIDAHAQELVKAASTELTSLDPESEYISYDDASKFVSLVNYYESKDATLVSGSRMEKYLKYHFFDHLYLYHYYLKYYYGESFFRELKYWYNNYYHYYSNLRKSNINPERTSYIQKRAAQLNSEEINKRLQSVLSNARFDFYLEKFDTDAEQEANEIGSKLSYNGQNLDVSKGEFSDPSKSSVHLTYVNFGNEKQFYDSDLWDALPEFGETLPIDAFNDEFIGGVSLGDYFLIFDGGSVLRLESSNFRAGGVTYTPSTIWPYNVESRGAQDVYWNVDPLADYGMFGYELFSFTGDIPLGGENVFSTTGYDMYIPEFDDNGNIVSVSKPLFYELRDPEDSIKDPQQFDRDTLINSLDLDTDDDGTNDAGVYRYKMVEKNDYDARVNGQKVVAPDDYQIFDVVVDGDGDIHFFLSDDIDDVSETYSDQSVEYEDQLGEIGYGLYINNYASQGSVTLRARKTVDGTIPESDQTFTFEVLDQDGNVVSTATSKRGSVTFDPISLTGDDVGKTLTYTIVEDKDSGTGGSYVYDTSYYTAEVTVGDSVDENGNISDISVVYYDSDGNEIDGEPVFKNETTTTETTSATGSISIHKILDTYNADKSIFNQQDLSLYGFTLYAKNDIVSPEDGTTVLYKAGTAVSEEVSCDKNGNAEISGILPGEYVLKETKMPAGTAAVTSEPEIRVVAEDSDSVSVYVNGQKQSSTDVINFENYVSKTEIQKKDESGEYLAGATLQLIDSATGEVQDTWVTGTMAHKVAGLEFGRSYTLREVAAPDGYQKADDITFVPEGAAVQTITMTDSKTQVTTDDDTDDTGDNDNTDNTDNTGDNDTTNTTTNTTTETSSGNGTTIVNTTSNGGTVSTTGSSNGTSDSTAVQSVDTGDGSMLPETAAATAAALAALGIILAARKRKADKR